MLTGPVLLSSAGLDLSPVTPVGRANANCLLSMKGFELLKADVTLSCDVAARMVVEGFQQRTAQRDSESQR